MKIVQDFGFEATKNTPPPCWLEERVVDDVIVAAVR